MNRRDFLKNTLAVAFLAPFSCLAAKASRVKNPINDVGVTRVYGLDDPKVLEKSGFAFARELDIRLPEGKAVAMGQTLYWAPQELPELKGLRILRPLFPLRAQDLPYSSGRCTSRH